MLKISVEGTLWAGNQLRLPVFGSLTMFWDVGKSRDGDLSEIENFVRKKGAQQTSPTMGPERRKERKNKRMRQSPNSFHKNQRLPGNL